MTVPREWDAGSYDALPLPHVQWGARTIGRLRLAGDERVLDAGCGTGRDAELLLDRLPHGRVVAVDGSANMLARLRERLADRLDRVDVVQADLTGATPLTDLVPEPVDAVVSVAAFHWITDHDALFATLASMLRPGGRISVDCGGYGNIVHVHAALEAVLGGRTVRPTSPWNFATAEETRERLLRNGFTDVEVQLRPDPARFDEGAQLLDYLSTVVLGAQLDTLPESERAAFTRAVAQRLPEPVVDYVRLEFTATRT